MDRFDNIPETALAWHRDGVGAALAVFGAGALVVGTLVRVGPGDKAPAIA